MEPKIATVGGTFATAGSTYREIQLDVGNMSVEQIARELESQAESPSLCHQCTAEVEDPELQELAGLNIDGVEYVQTDGAWEVYDPKVGR